MAEENSKLTVTDPSFIDLPKNTEWSLIENDKNLEPLCFSNGKSQKDIVEEVLESIKQGYRIIFIKGVCGSGKSAMALNLAKQFNKSSIVVPIKTLQKQYEHDYSKKKKIMKNDRELRINVIRGRSNFRCPYLEERPDINSSLGQFDDDYKGMRRVNNTCSNPELPCRIDIKKSNMEKIRQYLEENPKVNTSSQLAVSDVKRLSIAPVCPYWSPVVPSEIDLSILKNAECKNYDGLNNREYTIYKRKPGCGYYDQYHSYINSDVIIFNSHKYLLETTMNRKPATDLEIIDECDEFLDSLSNQKRINMYRLNMALGSLFVEDDEARKIVDEIIKTSKEIIEEREDDDFNRKAFDKKITEIGKTQIKDLLQLFLDGDIMDSAECDEENYCYHVEEVAKTFQDFFSETYVSFDRNRNKELVVRLVTTNIEERFKELLEKNKVFVMMSGTIHSEEVLRKVFGLSNFKIIEAETKNPGEIIPLKTGYEINCKYKNFRSGKYNREQYLYSLQHSIKRSRKPTLVHIISFYDLPSEEEAERLGLDIMTREKLRKLQREDSKGEVINEFKNGEIEVLYTTKCDRGVDFPGDTCNSIILTKYPYPNISSLFWRILKRNNPEYYNMFYLDKARRELLQRIYRGVRSEKDHIFLLSPDSRVFNRFSEAINN